MERKNYKINKGILFESISTMTVSYKLAWHHTHGHGNDDC
jgi:hypothetical protein